jgi:hypothetical protein
MAPSRMIGRSVAERSLEPVRPAVSLSGTLDPDWDPAAGTLENPAS